MDATHKAKLAQGRADARAVKAYLEFLENNKPKRGRRRTAESITKRLAAIETELESASALARLNLFQEQTDLQVELEAMGQKVDSKGIQRAAFRQMGIDAQTLREAGVK